MLRLTPPGEDDIKRARALPVGFNAPGTPPGEDGMQKGIGEENLELQAQQTAEEAVGGGDDSAPPASLDFLQIVRECEDQALLYVQQVNRKAWSQSYRAFHNEHYVGSKYTRPEWRGRSRLFVPKTRAAVRKDGAAVAASLFNNIDAINCLAGNESDPRQRGAAAVMEELVNYRTDRSSGKASFPWFLVSMGARQDAVLTGICVTKQYWLQEHRKTHEENFLEDDGTGQNSERTRDVYTLEKDRPDMLLIPPENIVISPAAQWTNPAQSAPFLIIKWPMQVEEIHAKMDAPVNPWKRVDDSVLKSSVESAKYDMAAIRRARELGLDRLDETQTGTHFQVVWVYECFVRIGGEDWTFYSVGDKEYLTDPRPVREVYPEQFGERPISIGYASLESHRIYPMAPAESWQPLQLEINDLRNLRLDANKQNVMPISKVRRGRQIDLDQVRRRSSGSSIIVQEPDDVTWEPAPQTPQGVVEMDRELTLELDDLAGQQNYGSVETHNALGKTLGGLKLAAGAANAVQEYDIRIWIETWATPALSQIVRLEQYYESDAIVLGIAGQKAQLMEKYGINKIDDDLLEQDVTVRVSVGLGAGDPHMRLAKFNEASQIVAPIIMASPAFQSGQREVDVDAIIEEVYGAAGYKDGGKRFFKDNGQPRANPMQDLQRQAILAKIDHDKKTGQASFFTGISNLAKVALGKKELESEVVDRLLARQVDARGIGFDHAHRSGELHLAATDHGHRHGLAMLEHRRNMANDAHSQAQDLAEQEAEAGGGAEMENAGAPRPASSGASPSGSPSASSPPTTNDALMQLLAEGKLDFTRGKDGRINGVKLPGQSGGRRTSSRASSYPVPVSGR